MGSCFPSRYVLEYSRHLHVLGAGMPLMMKVKTEPGLARAYAEMTQAVAGVLPCVPLLVEVATAHGYGGLHIPGLVVVGRRDSHTIAKTLWTDYQHELVAVFGGQQLVRRPHAIFGALISLVQGRIAAHELGHALDQAGVMSPYPFDPEAAADYFAGQLDACRNRSVRLGQLLFFSIGCVGPVCTHPSHPERAYAYQQGYFDQLDEIARGYVAASY